MRELPNQLEVAKREAFLLGEQGIRKLHSCIWNGNEIVFEDDPMLAVAGLAPGAPDEWGPIFAAAPELLEALRHIETYGSDTLSGRTDGPDDRERYREGVHEMTRIARTVLAKLDDLLAQRMSEAEGKLATRPVEQVVGELQAENRRLREVAERVVRANKEVDRLGYASLRRMVYALEKVLEEVQGDE